MEATVSFGPHPGGPSTLRLFIRAFPATAICLGFSAAGALTVGLAHLLVH